MFNTKFGQVIARRELIDAKDPSRRIIVSLGLPRQVGSGEWQCRVGIDGLTSDPIVKPVSGTDSVQALLLAFQYLRLSLKDSKCRLAWPDNGIPCPAGDIPRQVPTALGEEFAERIEQLIERETPRLLKVRGKMMRSHFQDAAKTRVSSERTLLRGRRRSE